MDIRENQIAGIPTILRKILHQFNQLMDSYMIIKRLHEQIGGNVIGGSAQQIISGHMKKFSQLQDSLSVRKIYTSLITGDCTPGNMELLAKFLLR